ncbi:MAG TPA: HAD family hydrolase [Kofleriaceae bacterium]|nr:HAD family hydrolase [Kofleriaceae bacterium]
MTFDAGQTLVELDLDFLARRVAMCAVVVEPAALRAAETAAWQHYDALVGAGRLDHPALWRALMAQLLTGAGARGDLPAAVDWLYTQQPVANLFRRPIDGMVELARELAGQGARVAVLSNSEGGLAALLGEIGIADAFERIIDSARVGFAKPDRRIFELVDRELGGELGGELGSGELRVHIGDSWAADVRGALDAGWRAIWFGRHARPVGDDPRVAIARDARELRAALVHFGALS